MDITLVIEPDPRRTLRISRYLVRPLFLKLTCVSVVGDVLIVSVTGGLHGVVSIALMISTPVILGLTLEWRARLGVRYIRRSRMTAELTEDSLRLSLPDRSSNWRWAAVQRVVDHRDAWLLKLSTHQALILPKEAFTDQQRAEFLAFAERKGFLVAAVASTRSRL
ncbi:YcxB family protein [Streptomyces guryensis]|uniref:YcxB family protein n=1 Tax=Streptomyces guryensis TaxID=2886947 RepID=A0A9Q3VUF9_9ACTN|nr:YcxB family protein [Streptomyces guryensis]MCD9880218.1 YcxB family protein [Streptomyces guryensis]